MLSHTAPTRRTHRAPGAALAALAATAGTLLATAAPASDRSIQDAVADPRAAAWTSLVAVPAEPEFRADPRRIPRFSYAVFDRDHDGRLDLIEVDRVAGLGRVRFDVPGWGFSAPVPLGLEGVADVLGGEHPAHGLGEAFAITRGDRRLHQLLFPTIESVVGLASAPLGYEPGFLVRQRPAGTATELWVIARDWRHATIFRPDEGLVPIAELIAEPGVSVREAWATFEGVLAEFRGGGAAEAADGAARLLPPRPMGDAVQDGLRWAEFEQASCREDAGLFGAPGSLLDQLQRAVMCQRIYDAQVAALLDRHTPTMQPNGLP